MDAFSLRRAALAVHRRLLPTERQSLGFSPYAWLIYVGFLYVEWFFRPIQPHEPLLYGVATLCFLVLYFRGFWVTGRRLAIIVAGMLSIGVLMALATRNPNVAIFFIFAAAFSGGFGTVRRGVVNLVAVSACALVCWLALDLSAFFLFMALTVGLAIGATNIYFTRKEFAEAELRLSQEEIRRLAQSRERERIAQDLHDALGQSLTMISLKAQLARKLADRDRGRMAVELVDIEQASQEALEALREVVAGYRHLELAGELASARLALASAGVEFRYRRDARALMSPPTEQALAYVLREAVTNVIRHAEATRCEASIRRSAGEVVLCLRDDGALAGTARLEGSGGLKNMRARLEAVSGSLSLRNARPGLELIARAPAPEDWQHSTAVPRTLPVG